MLIRWNARGFISYTKVLFLVAPYKTRHQYLAKNLICATAFQPSKKCFCLPILFSRQPVHVYPSSAYSTFHHHHHTANNTLRTKAKQTWRFLIKMEMKSLLPFVQVCIGCNHRLNLYGICYLGYIACNTRRVLCIRNVFWNLLLVFQQMCTGIAIVNVLCRLTHWICRSHEYYRGQYTDKTQTKPKQIKSNRVFSASKQIANEFWENKGLSFEHRLNTVSQTWAVCLLACFCFSRW